MQITSGSDWVVNGGMNRQLFSITLGEEDGAELDPSWGEKSWDERRTWLRKRADLEVLMHMFNAGAISKEFLSERVKLIKGSDQ